MNTPYTHTFADFNSFFEGRPECNLLTKLDFMISTPSQLIQGLYTFWVRTVLIPYIKIYGIIVRTQNGLNLTHLPKSRSLIRPLHICAPVLDTIKLFEGIGLYFIQIQSISLSPSLSLSLSLSYLVEKNPESSVCNDSHPPINNVTVNITCRCLVLPAKGRLGLRNFCIFILCQVKIPDEKKYQTCLSIGKKYKQTSSLILLATAISSGELQFCSYLNTYPMPLYSWSTEYRIKYIAC